MVFTTNRARQDPQCNAGIQQYFVNIIFVFAHLPEYALGQKVWFQTKSVTYIRTSEHVPLNLPFGVLDSVDITCLLLSSPPFVSKVHSV